MHNKLKRLCTVHGFMMILRILNLFVSLKIQLIAFTLIEVSDQLNYKARSDHFITLTSTLAILIAHTASCSLKQAALRLACAQLYVCWFYHDSTIENLRPSINLMMYGNIILIKITLYLYYIVDCKSKCNGGSAYLW